MRGCFKRFTGPPHPDRDGQFQYIEAQKDTCLKTGVPVISVDTKKKELIGNFSNHGKTWCRHALEVNAHDFPQDALCRAVPYGVYELNRQRGHVGVGTSSDTPRFAVDVITQWWRKYGRRAFPGKRRLLILADAGGSNSCRAHTWKQQLQQKVADRLGLKVTVCHYPVGASKWNPVEHRLFGPISTNWAGLPLRSLETMLGFIRGTKAVKATATLCPKAYPLGEKVSRQEMKALKIRPHKIYPKWNYTISPRLGRACSGP